MDVFIGFETVYKWPDRQLLNYCQLIAQYCILRICAIACREYPFNIEICINHISRPFIIIMSIPNWSIKTRKCFDLDLFIFCADASLNQKCHWLTPSGTDYRFFYKFCFFLSESKYLSEIAVIALVTKVCNIIFAARYPLD